MKTKLLFILLCLVSISAHAQSSLIDQIDAVDKAQQESDAADRANQRIQERHRAEQQKEIQAAKKQDKEYKDQLRDIELQEKKLRLQAATARVNRANEYILIRN